MPNPQPPKPAPNAAKKILGLFKKAPETSIWQPAAQLYPRLAPEIPGLAKQAGIYALWHLGVRPQWLRVGAVRDLADAFKQMSAHSAVVQHAGAGVFLAWSSPAPAQTAGIVRFLTIRLAPALQDEALAWDIP